MSRAYYAAFHAADSLLRATNPRWETPRHNAHEQIWNAVGSASAKREFWNLKVKGERLKVSRVCADYRVLQNPAREAENAVAQAQFIVTQVQALIAQ